MRSTRRRARCLEETSVGDLDFCWGETFVDTAPRTGHKIARYYVAVSPGARVFLPVSAELGRPEHHEFRWVGFPAAKALLSPALQPIIAWAASIPETPHLAARPVAAPRVAATMRRESSRDSLPFARNLNYAPADQLASGIEEI